MKAFLWKLRYARTMRRLLRDLTRSEAWYMAIEAHYAMPDACPFELAWDDYTYLVD